MKDFFCSVISIVMFMSVRLLVVGYIVGLGDRHVQNILVDCNTAELVHIDLGKCVQVKYFHFNVVFVEHSKMGFGE